MQKPAQLPDFPPIDSIASHNISKPNKNFYSAVAETIVFLSAMLILNSILGDGNRFITTDAHPFWIIVLLITVQYGSAEALTAAVLASLFLLVGNMPEQSLTETMYEYILRVSFLPFLWIVTALVLGSIRSRQLLEKEELSERLSGSEAGKEAIAKAYNSLKHTKERLELRLAEERRSVLTVYNIAKSLETLDPADALTEVSKLMKAAFNTSKFSLYRCKGDALHLEASHGWVSAASYLSQFDATTPMARSILEKKRILSIVNEADEQILNGQGMLAGPIFDTKTGKVYGMLKIEEISFMDMGIRTHETFRIVCEWVGRVYANVEKYQSACVRPAQEQPDTNNGTKLIPLDKLMIHPTLYAYPESKIAA
jgi:hypothetical protein